MSNPTIPSSSEMPELLSGTHLQILSVLAAELQKKGISAGDEINILDVGCGDGLLIDYLGHALPLLFKDVTFSIYGFDVGDHGVQPSGYFAKTIDDLSAAFPDVAWSERLALISERDLWPYADEFFTATVSNQVLEHVRDHDMFFAETARVTRTDGIGIHIYPSKHTLIEQHTLVPFAHLFRQHHRMQRMIEVWSRLNRGRYPEHKEKHPDITPLSYAKRHTDYLIRYTNFQYQPFFLDLAKKHQLHGTFKYSGLYLIEKLRRILGKESRFVAPEQRSFGERFAAFVGPYLTNVTLVISKSRDYDTPVASVDQKNAR